jgi:hypothetical protein
MSKQMEFHWLVVGYVSKGARAWIEEKGGRLRDLSSEPPLVAVALAYDPDGTWSWSQGEQQHHVGVEFWNHGYIEEPSTGIMLQYGNVAGSAPEFSSVVDNYIVLPDEDFDAEIRQVREGEPDDMGVGPSSEPVLVSDEGGDPFLPDFPD